MARVTAADCVEAVGVADLADLFRFWAGEQAARMPADEADVRSQVLEWMEDDDHLQARLAGMGKRLQAILDVHLGAPRNEVPTVELRSHRQLAYLSEYDLQASLAVLERHVLLASVKSAAMARHGVAAHQVPRDLAERILRLRRAQRRGVFDRTTLKGHLERLYSDPARKTRISAGRLREMYKMYSEEPAAVARIERLPDGLRQLVEKAVMQFGGVLPRSLFERIETDLPHWNGRRWGMILEESLVGTVGRLDLARYGLQHTDETLLVFNEVTLAWLRRVAVPGDPDAPHDEASLGVDLVSNLSRFIGYILDHNVRFTVRGEIFKTTERRILQELIPNPGRELERSEVLNFIFRFARREGLIEGTGERAFALTPASREWEPQALDQKLSTLLAYAVEETQLGGEYFHQARLRRIYLRLLKRSEPEVWYDLMYLPFLARNTYLASLDDLAVEDHFAEGAGVAARGAMDDLQRLAWNLVHWVRKRLYLLGVVDLGYDRRGHPVAVRLTRTGARLLGGVSVAADEAPGMGNLVVTPDYEVVLFPTGDDAELVHDLDRFCTREKRGYLIHFRIHEKGVARALSEGMSLPRLVAVLEEHSRTPVPQNVLYSIRDWACRAGLITLDRKGVLRCDNSEVFERFRRDPGARPYIRRVVDERTIELKGGATPRRQCALLCDLGYIIELAE
ncbi:MAG: helicase-associated domain-containing protein [Planctomycetota bacterium]|nr:helicase-associated domain-containing protein [Planctomycetota bacterium]MDP6764036.1 helicase-associated domain-containing protein [Planctomycetota bacterium]MDP6988004.1 helicase-associated domain-containing protein [Planctomycetota bacterium]